MVRLARLEENRDRDALLSRSMMDEIARLTSKNQEYEDRLNKISLELETIKGSSSRIQQEQHALPSPRTEMNQRYENCLKANKATKHVICLKQ